MILKYSHDDNRNKSIYIYNQYYGCGKRMIKSNSLNLADFLDCENVLLQSRYDVI